MTREECIRSFVREAMDANAEVEKGGAAYMAQDVHDWMERLARNGQAPRPKPRPRELDFPG